MEAEALESIFLEDFDQCDEYRWTLRLSPEADEAHVSLVLEVTTDAGYPSQSRPSFAIVDSTGLGADQLTALCAVATETANQAEGAVCVFEAATAIKDWLGDHNSAASEEEVSPPPPQKVIEDTRPVYVREATTPFTLEAFHQWWETFLNERSSQDDTASEATKTKPTGKFLFVKGSAQEEEEEDLPPPVAGGEKDADIDEALFLQADDDDLDDLDDLDDD